VLKYNLIRIADAVAIAKRKAFVKKAKRKTKICFNKTDFFIGKKLF
jgi:hypothetical protein